MTVIEVNPLEDARWQQLVAAGSSNLFHSPAWLRSIQQTYGLEPAALLLQTAAEKPIAGLPFFHISDILGDRIVALPFSDYCDPIVDSFTQWQELIEVLLLKGLPVMMRCLHNAIPLEDDRFELYNRAKWHGMDITPDEETLWSGFHGSARRAVRKAEKSGVTVRVAKTKEDLHRFFQLHLRVRKYKYGLLAQPYHFFENIWDNCIATGSGAVMLAIHEEEIIAGTMFLQWKDVFVYKFSVSDPTYLNYRPADLIVWEAAKYAKQRNLASIDFGLSDWDQDGLIRFKNKFASEEKTLSFIRRSVDGLPTESQKLTRRLVHQVTALLTDESVPDEITNKGGDLLYRYFS